LARPSGLRAAAGAAGFGAGTNDVAQNTGPETPLETEGYIKSMVELALASKVKVVLASIPPAVEPQRVGSAGTGDARSGRCPER
jgi:hypothetical protein